MNPDPTACILAAAIAGFLIGFFGCALYASNIIKKSNLAGWKEGVRFYQEREREARKPRL